MGLGRCDARWGGAACGATATNEWERGGACVGGSERSGRRGAGEVGGRDGGAGPAGLYALLCLDFVKDVDLIRKICSAVLYYNHADV